MIKDNRNGRYLRIKVAQPKSRPLIGIPALSMIYFKAILAKLLNEFGTHVGKFKGEQYKWEKEKKEIFSATDSNEEKNKNRRIVNNIIWK